MGVDIHAEIVRHHFIEYPNMQLQDLYKLLYQGVMGSGHAVSSFAAAEKWLSDELLSMGTGFSGEAIVERLSSSIVRVNLRPYAASGGDAACLLEGFVRTAREFSGSTDQLSRAWKSVAEIQHHFSLLEMESYFTEMEKSGFPVVHHSEIYFKLYRPAYRVVCTKELKCLGCE